MRKHVITSGTKRFWGSERGSVAIIFSIAAVAVLMAAGVAIDYGRSITMQSKVQAAADAGVLAAVRQGTINKNLPVAQLEQIARDYFDDNLPAGNKLTITNFALVAAGDGYRLQVTAAMPASLTSVAGFDQFNLGATSQAEIGPGRPLEVALVLDNTGSMAGAKLSSLKTSAHDLVDKLMEDNSGPNSQTKVALVPFNTYVNVGLANRNAPWISVPDDYTDGSGTHTWNGCVGSRGYPLNVQDQDYNFTAVPGLLDEICTQPITPLTNDKAVVSAGIDNMTANSRTYIPAGLAWGWRALSKQKPYSEGKTYVEAKDEGGIKAVVLMTDGANTLYPAYPSHEPTDYANGPQQANTLTAELCTNIKNEEITIYTVAFEITDTVIKDLLKSCASKTSYYYDADNATELSSAFQAIAGELAQLKLTK